MNILDHIFPKQCLICSRIGFDICDRCINSFSYTLPYCCICKKLSNGYWTHTKCFPKCIQCLTGWYESQEYGYVLEKRVDQGIYSVHSYMLKILVKRFNLEEYISKSNIYHIKCSNSQENSLNIYLAKSLNTSQKKDSNQILFVGNRLENIEQLNLEKEGLFKKPFNIKILTLFTQSLIPYPTLPPLQPPLQ